MAHRSQLVWSGFVSLWWMSCNKDEIEEDVCSLFLCGLVLECTVFFSFYLEVHLSSFS